MPELRPRQSGTFVPRAREDPGNADSDVVPWALLVGPNDRTKLGARGTSVATRDEGAWVVAGSPAGHLTATAGTWQPYQVSIGVWRMGHRFPPRGYGWFGWSFLARSRPSWLCPRVPWFRQDP